MRRRLSNGVAVRAAIGFAMASAITALAIFASATLSFRAADQREAILTRYADDLINAAGVQAAAEGMVAAGRGYLLTGTAALLEDVGVARKSLDEALDALDRVDTTAVERDLQGAVRQSAKRYEDRLDELMRATATGDDRVTLAHAFRDDLLPARQALDGAVGRLVAQKRRLHDDARRRTARVARQTIRATEWLGIISLAASLALAWRFTDGLSAIYRRERESSEKAAEALAAKEEILRIVAHDLRSPLASISLRASLLVRHAHGEATVTTSASAIRHTCDRMAELIDGLVQAASIEAGRLAITLGSCAVSEAVAAVVETFTPAARQAGIALEPRVEPAELHVVADRSRLVQALSNLVGNALKFTPAGGRVEVRASARASGVIFAVSDTGRGIAPEDLPHVFERFWKRDAQVTRGAGLGLFIANGIVAAHGGRITVQSRVNEGSTFTFELPDAPALAQRSPEAFGPGALRERPAT